MKVLITGAGGFIGNYLLGSFQSDNNEIIAAYRNHCPEIKDPAAGSVRLVRTDLSESVEGLEPVDVVIHTAGHTNQIPDSTADDYIRSNVLGTLNLANYAKAANPRIFIYLSTISMYGEASNLELDEDAPLNNPSIYGYTKYMGELILKDYARYFPSVCIRLPGVVGPGYFKPWIGRVLQKALGNEPISFYNPEFTFNNVVHLADLARFISTVIESGAQGYNYVTLAADAPMAIRDVVQLIINLTGSGSQALENDTNKSSFLIRQDKIKDVYQFQPATTDWTIRRYVKENLGSYSLSQGTRVTG